MPPRAFAIGTVFSSDMVPIGKRDEAVDTVARQNDNVSAIATVSAIGSAARHKFLATKTHAAVAASPAENFNLHAINKHGLQE
jgi:hypothetical protein